MIWDKRTQTHTRGKSSVALGRHGRTGYSAVFGAVLYALVLNYARVNYNTTPANFHVYRSSSKSSCKMLVATHFGSANVQRSSSDTFPRKRKRLSGVL
ncbi:hypothetical protein BaRGS_00014330 [Batillaria attramentaria]|uniref:Uncharacterized protein n=1 Tax=Batillaria attramentaria TaxID=370345 RepID=A0ABD0L4G7_9CAEN